MEDSTATNPVPMSGTRRHALVVALIGRAEGGSVDEPLGREHCQRGRFSTSWGCSAGGT